MEDIFREEVAIRQARLAKNSETAESFSELSKVVKEIAINLVLQL